MKLSLIKRVFCLLTFNLNVKMHAHFTLQRCKHLHTHKEIIEFETKPVLVFWLTFFLMRAMNIYAVKPNQNVTI